MANHGMIDQAGKLQNVIDGLVRSVVQVPEYGVQVEGIGGVWVENPLTFVVRPDRQPTTFATLDEAEKLARNVKAAYERMGCDTVVGRVRVIARTVTTTRGQWVPAADYTAAPFESP